MMNLPEPVEVTPRIAPRAPEKTSPADKDPRISEKLDEPEKGDDASFVEELALAIGAINPLPLVPLSTWTPPETADSAPKRDLSLQVERPETVAVAALPVFFAIPPSETKVMPTDFLTQMPVHLAPPAVPQWVAGEVRRFENSGQAMTQLSVQLDPPDLGKLQLTLTMVDKQVAVELAISAQAKPRLEDSLAGIRQILASANLVTKEVKVVTSASSKNSAQQDAYPQQNRWARRRSRDDDSMSVQA